MSNAFLNGHYQLNERRVHGRQMYQFINGTYGIWFDGGKWNMWRIGNITDVDKGRFSYAYVSSEQNTMCPNFDNAAMENLNSKWSVIPKGRVTFIGKPLLKN